MSKKVITAVCVALLLAGCYKVDIYNTPHPDKGAVQITTDWTKHSLDAVLPKSYILRIGGAGQTSRSTDSANPTTSAGYEEQTVQGNTNLFKSLFLPGTLGLMVYNKPEGITVNGSTASVNTLEDRTLSPMPGVLFSAFKELQVKKDDTLKVTVPMIQRIRTLALTLKLAPGDEQRIFGTSARLTNIASAVDLATGNIADTEGKTVAPLFTLKKGTGSGSTPTTGNPTLEATLRLFGVMTGMKQELRIDIALSNGTVQTIVTDLTNALKNFGNGEIDPLILDAALTLPPEADVTATISDWKKVNNGEIVVK